MSKKKNNRNNILNSKGKEIYTLLTSFSPEAYAFIQERTVEIMESSIVVKPTPPFIGNIYCVEFENSTYRRILKELKLLALILCQNKQIRTFLGNTNCIYIVSPYSSDVIIPEINAACGYLVLFLYDMDKSQNKIDPETEILAHQLLKGFKEKGLEWYSNNDVNGNA